MKDLLTILGLCVLFAIFAFVAIIYSKYPEARLDAGHFVKTETSQTDDRSFGPFEPNYTNTNIFSCGAIDFTMYLPEQKLHFVNLTEDDFIHKYYWGTEWSVERGSKVKFICTSSDKFKEGNQAIEAYLNEGNKIEDLEDPESYHQDTDGHSVLIDRSAWNENGYEFDTVYKKNEFGTELDTEYVLFKSKVMLNEEKNVIANIDIWYYTDAYGENATTTFQSLFDSLKILE